MISVDVDCSLIIDAVYCTKQCDEYAKLRCVRLLQMKLECECVF